MGKGMHWGVKCEVLSCRLRKRDSPSSKFFKFPTKGSDLFNKWVTACGLTIPPKPNNAYVCCKHFLASSKGVRYLKRGAIPTLNLSCVPEESTSDETFHIPVLFSGKTFCKKTNDSEENRMQDFNKVCRSCNSEKTNLLNLFANDGDDEPTLGEKYLECTSLNLENGDEFPQSICYSCAKLLELAYKFRKQSQKSFDELKKIIDSKLPPKEIKIEKISENEEMPIEIIDEEIEANESDCRVIDLQNTIILTESEKPVNHINQNKRTNQEDINQDRASKIFIHRSVTNDQSINRPHKCVDCNKGFFTLKAFELHNKINHKETQEIIKLPKTDETDEYECDYIIEVSNQSIKCDYCEKCLESKETLEIHMQTHKSPRPYTCKICLKQYTDQRYLHRHMLYHQTIRYRCSANDCGKYFNIKHKLTEHLRRYHNTNLTSEEVRKIKPEIDSNP